MVFTERLTPILLLMMGRKQRMRAIARGFRGTLWLREHQRATSSMLFASFMVHTGDI